MKPCNDALLSFSPGGKAVAVGHADGSIIRYCFEDEGLGDTNVSSF